MCIDVANKIIERTNAQNYWRYKIGKPWIKLTGKRVQKLLYLCKLLWYVEHEECPMFDADFEAWPNGPVIPKIYDYFKVYQDGDMQPRLDKSSYILSEEELDIINKVVDNTTDISTEAIIDYTLESGCPQANAFEGYGSQYNKIYNEAIKVFIRKPENLDKLFEFFAKNNIPDEMNPTSANSQPIT